MRTRATLVSLLAGTILFGACSDHPAEAPPGSDRPNAQASLTPDAQGNDHPGERAFQELARRIPAFGGFYLDTAGDLVVRLTDLGQAPAARAAVAHVLQQLAAERNNPGARLPEFRFEPAEYSFAQLSEWRDRAAPVFGLDAVVALDLDEQRNRLTFGLKDASGRAEVEARIADLGIPLQAVHLEVIGQSMSLASRSMAAASMTSTGCTHLREFCRPLIGGYQITFLQDGRELYCTLGIGAIRGGSQLGFVTNAHCSDDEWNLDQTPYWQPNSGEPHMGREAVDPKGWGSLSGCEVFFVCRESDANFVQTGSGVEVDVGYIARPAGRGTLYIDTSNPRLTITSTSQVYGGETVYMVGRTSGLLSGRVVHTCEHIKKTGQGRWHKVLCQDVHDGASRDGDSGSPVFLWSGGDHVTFLGVHWGGNDFWGHSYFSPIRNIRNDLGGLEVRAPDYRSTTGGGGSGGGVDCGTSNDPTVVIESC